MAQDMGRGILAPENNSTIGTGASEMRTLAATTAAAIDILDALKVSIADAERYGIPGPQGKPGPRGIPGPGAVPADEAVAAYLSSKGTQTQQTADARYLQQGSLSVSVDAFGAVGDGVTDDTAALQAALDAGASFGQTFVYAPTGAYRISAPLRVPANTHFFSPRALLVSDIPGLEAFITIWGSYLAAKHFELAKPANAGDRVLTTKTPHTYQPGDVLRLVSQRVATNPDDAGNDQLGWATGYQNTGTGPYFAEFVRVQNVTDTTLTLDNGLLFNGYRPDNTQETDPAAGESAYLADTNGRGDNVIVSGFEFDGEADYGVRVIRAKNVRLRDISWTRELPGRFIQFMDCYYADGERCYIETRQWEESDQGVDHAAINQYHVVGSWRSGFTNCRSVRGTQPYDFTYALNMAPYPAVWCYVRTSTAEGVLHNPVTGHPGTYGTVVENNIFTDCQHSGISMRSNAAEITHNIVVGSFKDERVGLYVFEGGGKQSRIESNTIANFDIAARLNDGGDKPFPDRVDTVFRNNTFRDFRIGWLRTRTNGTTMVPLVPQGISLVGNRFETNNPEAIGIITCEDARGIHGLVIDSNEFIMRNAGASSAAILVTANSRDTLIRNNVIHEARYFLRYISDGHTGAADTITMSDNHLMMVTSPTVPASTGTLQVRNQTNEIHAVSGQPDLNHYLVNGKWRTGNSNVLQAYGFPFDNAQCWWEVEEYNASTVIQTVHRTASPQATYRRRVVNGTPQAWESIVMS